jgi:hypothetical protein
MFLFGGYGYAELSCFNGKNPTHLQVIYQCTHTSVSVHIFLAQGTKG